MTRDAGSDAELRREPDPWTTLEVSESVDYGILAVERTRRRSPRTGKAGVYTVLRSPDWINVIALTSQSEVVLVRQYRHGIDRVTLEIPGGMVDPGETPAQAASRELLEETGYAGAEPVWLGSVFPNPALFDNRCHTYLVRDARAVGVPAFEEGEDLTVELAPTHALTELVLSGAITHSLVVSAFHWFALRPHCRGPAHSPGPGPG